MKHVSDFFQLSATDLSNHLGCNHLTQLNRLVALGERAKATWYDPSLEILIQRGQEHEKAYVEFLRKKILLSYSRCTTKLDDGAIAFQNIALNNK